MKKSTVYRIERKGFGPFRVDSHYAAVLKAKDMHLCLWHAINYNGPGWMYEDALMERINELRQEGLSKADFLAGGKSKKQLRYWINRRHTLENLGFKVVEYLVPEKHIAYGEYQVAFHKPSAKKVKTHKITEFFKR